MKYLFLLLTLLAFSSSVFGQNNTEDSVFSEIEQNEEEDEYPSSGMKKYYKEIRKLYPLRNLPSRRDALKFNSPYCKIMEIENYSPYVDSIIWTTPYMDSIRDIYIAQMAAGNYSYNEPHEELAGVYKGWIIKHEKKGSVEAFIYTSGEYSNLAFADSSIWIALSKDKGKTWKHYFTGLYEKQPIDMKWYSKLPLIVNESTFQIEAGLVHQTQEHAISRIFSRI